MPTAVTIAASSGSIRLRCDLGAQERPRLSIHGSRISVGAVRSASRAQLNEWVAEVTVDCYNESECITAFYTTLQEQLQLPFKTELLGVAVMVESIDLTDDEQIVAVCARGGTRQHITILDLPLSAPPGGAEWIEAYRHWARGTTR
jgi:hypothetical protein